jgi:hypothetical protein
VTEYKQRPEPDTEPVKLTIQELAATHAALLIYIADLAKVDLTKGAEWEIGLHKTVAAAAETARVKVVAEMRKANGDEPR